MNDAEILLVRHPETEANITGRFVGRGHSPYSDEGRLQFARVPRKVAKFEPDVIWSSPLERAHRLALASAAASGLKIRVDDRLVELDFGQAEGKNFGEIAAAKIPFNYQDREAPVAPGGESRGDIERRSAQFCDEIVSAGGKHVIVTHGGVFRASLVHLLGLASSEIWAFHIHNAQLAYIRVIDGHGMLEKYVQG
jgi:broad specificity phosphatase PhoE